MHSFTAALQPVPHGGMYVVVPAEVATAAGLRHGQRVRGTVDGAPYRSALMKYSGDFHVGLHKATLTSIGAVAGQSVLVAIEPDDQPLPTDVVPDDLAQALAGRPEAAAAWQALAPSHRREHVKAILEAKRPETRTRRITACVEALLERAAQARPTARTQRRSRTDSATGHPPDRGS